jgi:ribose/xylose/arabinose/galactoside ABC-type transport system permease subunit
MTELMSSQVRREERGLLTLRDRLGRAQNVGVVALLVIVCIITSILKPAFLTPDNLLNIASNAALLSVVSFGMVLVIAVAGLDLSVGSTQAAAALLGAQLGNSAGVLAGLAAGIAAGLLVGLVNGVVTLRLLVPSFIVTLGTMSAVRGFALIDVNGGNVAVRDPGMVWLGNGRLLGIPVLILIAVVLMLIMVGIVRYTAFGRHLVAVGGGEAAALSSGIGVKRVKLAAYVACGGLAGLSGVLLAGQIGTVDGALGQGLELQSIAVAVLGGASLAGGRANLVGAALATLLIAAINASMNLLNIPAFYQYLTTGVLLIAALALDALRRRATRNLRRAG